jgi:hypothetical protein
VKSLGPVPIKGQPRPIEVYGADELRAGMARLMAHEFIYETVLFPEVEYTVLVDAPGVVHFAVPARDWWRDIGFT